MPQKAKIVGRRKTKNERRLGKKTCIKGTKWTLT
jgi:hypothetical protein